MHKRVDIKLVRKKNRVPSDNYCVICGRFTNDRKLIGDEWANRFYICHKCKKVWCVSCMGQISGMSASKSYKLGKKGRSKCPDCGNLAVMTKLPENLPFKQVKTTSESRKPQFCKFCGEKLDSEIEICDICGAEQ